MRLKDKIVVITGAGSGLGRESALLFSSEGAKIVVTDLSEARAKLVCEEVLGAGGQAVWTQADVRVESDMVDAVALGIDAFGRIDVMFANAGIAEIGFGMVAFEDLTLENFDAVIATNLVGVFLACKAAVPAMKRQGSGTIVVTSSASSLVAYPRFPSYVASKHAVNGLVKAMSMDLGRHGIRANALCPTHGMSANLAMAPDADVLGKSYEELGGEWISDNAAMPLRLNRPPTIRDNANVALFLASDESAYMSGVCIPATDGGNIARTSIAFPQDFGETPGSISPLVEG